MPRKTDPTTKCKQMKNYGMLCKYEWNQVKQLTELRYMREENNFWYRVKQQRQE